jgi:hypothetical protein
MTQFWVRQAAGESRQERHTTLWRYGKQFPVSEGLGVAILTAPMALEIHSQDIVVKALPDNPLSFQTCLIRRVDDKSRLTKEFAHAFLSRFTNRPPVPVQLALPLTIRDHRLG